LERPDAHGFRFTSVHLRDSLAVLGNAATGWNKDNAPRLSAALAYYALFSLAPLLLLGVMIASVALGEAAARGEVADEMRQYAGGRTADAIQVMLLTSSRKTAGIVATGVGLAALLFGASGVFTELKDALNTIWGVQLKPGRPIRALVRERLISFAMVLGVGLVLLASLVLSAVITAAESSLGRLFSQPALVWQGADIAVSVVVMTLLFAAVFKIMPNVIIHWRDVWAGAGLTAFLFTMGKFLIGFYLGTSRVASYYGAAGSAIIVLLWVYYSACILFFGAEFTKACLLMGGGTIRPDKRAMFRNHQIQGGAEIGSKT